MAFDEIGLFGEVGDRPRNAPGKVKGGENCQNRCENAEHNDGGGDIAGGGEGDCLALARDDNPSQRWIIVDHGETGEDGLLPARFAEGSTLRAVHAGQDIAGIGLRPE